MHCFVLRHLSLFKICIFSFRIQAIQAQIIKSQGIAPTKPKDMYDALEKIFRQESNNTITNSDFVA